MTEPNEPTDDRREVQLRYVDSSSVQTRDGSDLVNMHTNALRTQVQLRAKFAKPLLIRETLAALYDVVSGDMSYKPKDRSAYLAYQAMKKQAALANAWDARQAYFDWLERNDPNAWLVLDPIVSVFPDRLQFEVFSKDEGAYAVASIDLSACELDGKPVCGTTNIDFSKEFITGVERIRSYRDTTLSIGAEEVAVETEGERTVEKKIKLPYSWIRGMLQVQSAAVLPRTPIRLAPLDLYNALRHLRLNKDQKKGGRALRLELIPGEFPRIVLEPWNTAIDTAQERYQGSQPSVVRLWGRRRLKVLGRLLAFAESLELHVLGSGMPAYLVLHAGPVTFTLATTGFSSANWAQGLAFDLLLPRESGPSPLLDEVVAHLANTHAATLDELADALSQAKPLVTAALQAGCQQGLLMMFDLSHFRLRPLLDEPLPAEALRFRSRRERLGHDLLAQKGCVSLESENHIHAVGVEIVGKVKIRAEKREYRPLLRMSGEGRVLKAECTCPFYRKHALKEGPCEHLIALRLHYGKLELDRKQNPDRSSVTLETRSYTRRRGKNETVYQLTLDHSRLVKRWGESGAKPRVQTLIFNSVDDSRIAFFEQVDSLLGRGYIDSRA